MADVFQKVALGEMTIGIVISVYRKPTSTKQFALPAFSKMQVSVPGVRAKTKSKMHDRSIVVECQ